MQEQPSDSFKADPANPTPSNPVTETRPLKAAVWGLVDQQATEDRDDVLVYTSDVLTEPLTFAGNIEAKLHVSTNTPDADWVIKLIDVHPNGFAPHVARGILRGRYRHSLLNPELMQPELMQPEQIHHRPGALSRIVLPVLIPEPTR